MVIRTFFSIICLSFLLSLSGIVIDIDHPIAFMLGISQQRTLHYNPVFCVVYVLCWGLIVTAFAFRWNIVR